MNEPGRDMPNRRRCFRAGVQGCAIVHAPGDIAIRCVVVDLGLGGVRLLEPVRDQPLAPGTEVKVELECSGAGWVVQAGRVLRHSNGEIVVLFHALSPEVEDLIEDQVLGAVEAQRAPRIVVVDRWESRRRHVAEALRESGCSPLEASTPLEAVDLIECSRHHVCAVALSEQLTQTQADDLVRFIHEMHPEVKLALIADRDTTAEPRWPVAAVIRVEDDHVLAGSVRELAAKVRLAMAAH